MRSIVPLLLAASALVNACGLLPLVKHRHEIVATSPRATLAVRDGLRVAILPVAVDESIDRREFIVRTAEGEIETSSGYLWHAAPSALATRFALAHADGAMPAAMIATGAAGADYVVRLTILEMITTLDGNCDPTTLRMRVAVSIDRDAYARRARQLYSDVLTREVAVEGGELSGVAASAGRALGDVIDSALSVVAADAARPAIPAGITMLALDESNEGVAIVIRRTADGTLSTLELERGRQPYMAYGIEGFSTAQLDAVVKLTGSGATAATLALRDGAYTLVLSRASGVATYRIFDPSPAAIAQWIRSIEQPTGRVVQSDSGSDGQ